MRGARGHAGSLLVWAGGRWRALRAAGPRGAVCVARRGRLVPLRRLRRAALTLGPALRYKSTRRAAARKQASVAVQCGQGPRSPGGAARAGGSQPQRSSSSEPAETSQTFHQKRKRQSTSSEDSARKMSPKKSLNLKRKVGPLKRKRSMEEDSPVLRSHQSKRVNRTQNNPEHQHTKLVERREATCSDEMTSVRTKREIVSLVLSTDESDFEIKNDKPKPKSSSADQPARRGPNRTQDRSSADEPRNPGSRRALGAPADEPVKRNLRPSRRTIDKPSRKEPVRIDPTKSIDKYSTDEPVIHKKGPKRATAPTKEPRPQEATASHSEMVPRAEQSPSIYKELVIEERDVEAIRLFLLKHGSDDELLRFDTDSEYKAMYFYRINPLVSVERCPRIASMLRADSRLTLLAFASKLGLRSVSEASSVKRYRTRRTGRKSYVLDSSDAEDKENVDKPPPPGKAASSDKVLRESLNRARGKNDGRAAARERAIAGTMDTVELSSATESDHEKGGVEKATKKLQPIKHKVISSKRAGSKEYSNLEDHAIVAWVSTGARASSVNGNRLWKQLQEQYPRLTGHGRTWHSLRNRYLRYILPRLAALCLPPALQARLRAAAATGELKARNKEPRRNSMFPLPPRGASSRRPRPFALPSHADRTGDRAEDVAGTELSPRYSALTRQFARTQAERRQPSERSAEPAPERSAASEPSPARRNLPQKSPDNYNRRQSASRRRSPRPRPAAPRKPPDSAGSSARKSARRTSTSSDSTSDDSNRRDSSIDINRRKSNRRNSPVDTNRRKSNRRNLSIDINRRKSNRRNSPNELNRRDSPVDTNRRKSNRRNSPNELNRRDSPVDTNRRKSNRRNSPNELNRRDSPVDTNRRKSNRRNSPNELNRRDSPVDTNRRKSNRRNSPSDSSASESTELSIEPPRARRRAPVESPGRLLRNKQTSQPSPARPPRLRKLFNHKAVF